jgi:hypothetical protein
MKGYGMPMLATIDDYIVAKLTHSVHTSERRSFRGCRRRHGWLFREFYYPRTTAKPLEFGVAYHVGMETYWDPRLWNKPRDIVLEMAIQAFRQKCQEQLDKYKKLTLQEGQELSDETAADYKERKELGEGMLRYFHEVASQDPRLQHLRPIKVEIPFEIPIDDGPEGQLWCKCSTCWTRYKAYMRTQFPTISFDVDGDGDDGIHSEAWESWGGLPVTYGGRIDALFIGPDGRVWIFDWKTAARLSSEDDRTEFLELDDQILSYCAALWKLGVDVAGFVYFEQKKALSEEPEPLVRPRLGRMFSVSKSASYNVEVYERTVKENDPVAYEGGLYTDYIEYLREEGGRFHMAYKEHRTPEQMRICLEDIYEEAQDIIDPELRIYKNAGRFNCQWCAFKEPCKEKSGGGDYVYALETMFEKRRYHYWEEKEASTDSKGGE